MPSAAHRLHVDEENKVVLDPDQQVQECIRLIFSLFRRTGSAYALVRHFRDKGLLFPSRPLFGPNRHELIWVPLQRSTIMRVLNNPRYAGAYFYGRTRGRRRLNDRGLASGRRMKFTGQIIGALRKTNHLKSRYERLRERSMLDVSEMAALLGTSMRTIYIWHRQGRLRPHRYNDSGAYLYEPPDEESPLLLPDRKYRRGKTADRLIHSTNNEVQYEA